MIGILSDAHGNRPAFDTTIELLGREGASRFVFLGDAVGYIPGAAVLDAIRELGETITCVRGNHDAMVSSGSFDDSRDHIYQHRRTRALIGADGIDVMIRWPAQRVIAYPCGRALMIHGSPPDPTSGYVYPDADLAGFTVEEDFVFMGHTHRPFVRRSGRTLFVNVGSCGLPRDDGRVGAAALFDEHAGEVQILRFDIEQQTRDLLATVPGVHASVLSLAVRAGVPVGGDLRGR